MAHPPSETSDTSLKSFLQQIIFYNKIQTIKEMRKGVKLDFKSTKVFQQSLPLLSDVWSMIDFPVWINADIFPGPVNNNETIPVDAQIFFDGIKCLPNTVLSIGWTTKWSSNFSQGIYTEDQVDAMLDGIKMNKIMNEITFPVRAGIAAQSLMQLDRLFKSLDSNNVTFTIWSSENDFVDVKLLTQLIFHFGVDKVYIDVPELLSKQLQLDNKEVSCV